MDAYEASKPCTYIVATVTKSNPLEIKISQKMPALDEDFLVITQSAKDADLKEGDKVLTIRKKGGKEYAVIDKVV